MSFFTPFVIPPTLATPADLGTWTGAPVPTNAAALLRSASSLVLDATEGTYYDIDITTGLATDPIIKQAMNDATCIQAAAWAAIGYNPLTGGVATVKIATSKKIGSGAVTYSNAGSDASAAAQVAAATQLVPDALRKLQQNNLLGTTGYMLS